MADFDSSLNHLSMTGTLHGDTDTDYSHRMPFAMANPPPLRLTLTLPTSKPIAAITGAGGLSAVPALMSRRGVAKHEVSRPIDEWTRIPQFATNTPACPGCVMTVAGQVPTAGVGSLRPVSSRGWVEPHPRNLPWRAANAMAQLPIGVVQRALSFATTELLDGVAVVVCRQWYLAVTSSKVLQARRFTFVFSGEDYDRRGIIDYLGRKVNHRGVRSSAACGEAPWYNPCVGLNSALKVACSHLAEEEQRRAGNAEVAPVGPVACVGPVGGGATRRVSATGVMSRGSGAAVGTAVTISKVDDGHLAPLSNLLSRGVSHFATENLPYSWVGVDFGDFRVKVSHYTFGTSLKDQSALPVSWELQGSFADGEGSTTARSGATWGDYTWFVLDRRSSDIFTHDRRSATFAVSPAVVASRGAVRMLRIVQTARNSQWGNELVVSGLEFYGNLYKH